MPAFLLLIRLSASLPLLASDDKITLPPPDDPLLIAALIASAIWLALLGLFAFSTRTKDVEAGPAVMDLSGEPPAVVNLLVNEGRVTANGVQATLLDLAARNYLDIEEYGAGEQVVCRLRSEPPGDNPEPFARIVLDHVRGEAVNGVVVAQALTTGAKGKADAWFRQFQKAVKEEARSRGLTEDRWTKPMWGIQRLVGLGAAALILLVAWQANAIEGAILALLIIAGSVHGVLVKLFGDQRLTEAGRTAAAHWLGVRTYLDDNGKFGIDTPGAVNTWDRYLAYAASMGLANKAIRSLPMGAEDDHKAWSAYGGVWREVRVSYPKVRIIWGRSPLGALLTALVIGSMGGGLIWLALKVRGFTDGYAETDEVSPWVRLGATIAIAVGIVLLVWGVRTLWLALTSFGNRIDVTGEIIRCRSFETDDKHTVYFFAVDDGKAVRVRAWRVPQTTYHRFHEGNVVRATISPRLGYVHHIDTLRPSSPIDAPAANPSATT